MLRFNLNGNQYLIKSTGFQYILCYGSTGALDVTGLSINTFQYILCYGSTKSGMNG